MTRLDRQSFLGVDSEATLKAARVAFVGLGGGGSHGVQQSAHLGIGRYLLLDPDSIDETNTNRLVGGTLDDVKHGIRKIDIASRMIRCLQPNAQIDAFDCDWHEKLDMLKGCDVIFGAVDTFAQRDQLERFARRYMIPYVDVGMDVIDLKDSGFLISGQVIASIPGGPCMRCCNFITEARLAQEAKDYGAAGPKPQVVWPNGVLASSAVGIIVNMLTPWHRTDETFVYLEYDGNQRTVVRSFWCDRLVDYQCRHFSNAEIGDVSFDIRGCAEPKTVEVNQTLAATSLRKSWWQRLFS